MENKGDEKKPKGGRNLVLLGLFSTLIALSTTGVSLAIYHNSGDIYLDRSRPGYLPDEEEIEENEGEKEEDYTFEKTGKLSEKVLEEYLTKLKVEIEATEEYKEPFGMEIMSDEYLGILERKDEESIEDSALLDAE